MPFVLFRAVFFLNQWRESTELCCCLFRYPKLLGNAISHCVATHDASWADSMSLLILTVTIIPFTSMLHLVTLSVVFVASDAEPRRGFFPQSYGTFKQRVISGTTDFFSLWSIEQKVYLWTYNQYSWWTRTGPSGRIALWRVIYQSVQKIQIWILNSMGKLVLELSYQVLILKKILGFGIIPFLLKPVFCLFS